MFEITLNLKIFYIIKNDFPNLQFVIPNFKINAIIFKSGKIVFIDGTDLEDVKKAFRLLKENLVDIGIL